MGALLASLVGCAPGPAGRGFAEASPAVTAERDRFTQWRAEYVSDFTVSSDRDMTIEVVCNGHLGNWFGLAAALWATWDPHSAE